MPANKTVVCQRCVSDPLTAKNIYDKFFKSHPMCSSYRIPFTYVSSYFFFIWEKYCTLNLSIKSLHCETKYSALSSMVVFVNKISQIYFNYEPLQCSREKPKGTKSSGRGWWKTRKSREKCLPHGVLASLMIFILYYKRREGNLEEISACKKTR